MNTAKKIILGIGTVIISLYLSLLTLTIFKNVNFLQGLVIYASSFLVIEYFWFWLIFKNKRSKNIEDGIKKTDYKGIILIIVGFLVLAYIIMLIYFLNHLPLLR